MVSDTLAAGERIEIQGAFTGFQIARPDNQALPGNPAGGGRPRCNVALRLVLPGHCQHHLPRHRRGSRHDRSRPTMRCQDNDRCFLASRRDNCPLEGGEGHRARAVSMSSPADAPQPTAPAKSPASNCNGARLLRACQVQSAGLSASRAASSLSIRNSATRSMFS